ncbi:MAG TPA: hypothetical protein VNN25_08440 [Thermoanaerobaculia bacterium]|nr:hypothetical protein [Thermoanaerobaculia bacterium]
MSRTPAEIFQNPDKIIETPTAITPLQRGGLLLETERTPLQRELAPLPAGGNASAASPLRT